MKIDPDIHIVMYLVFFGKTSVTRSQGEGGLCGGPAGDGVAREEKGGGGFTGGRERMLGFDVGGLVELLFGLQMSYSFLRKNLCEGI
jgi:hypothetical protein